MSLSPASALSKCLKQVIYFMVSLFLKKRPAKKMSSAREPPMSPLQPFLESSSWKQSLSVTQRSEPESQEPLNLSLPWVVCLFFMCVCVHTHASCISRPEEVLDLASCKPPDLGAEN